MSVVSRRCDGEADYERLRRMLIAAVGTGDERHYCTLGDLDWWRFTSNDPDPLAAAQLWLDGDEAIGAVWSGGDQAELLIHPHHRAVEESMLDWVEARHRERHTGESAPPPLTTYAFDGDVDRVARLRRRGYERQDRCYRYRRRPLDGPIAAPVLPAGYTLRHVVGEADLEARVAVHRAAFAPSRMTTEKHRAVMAAPTYRPELDLVAVAPDGRFASYCIAWFDATNRIGVFEPVGTDPAFQRLDLSKAVLTEGLRRLHALGAEIAYVITNGDNVAANPLYETVGFRVVDENHAWVKA
jgi:ribosomal protein S18 acetylase RimI-like enzyme